MSAQFLVQIVEDDPLIGLDLKRALEGFGYNVTGPCVTAEEAIENVAKKKPNLILMDINLKGEMDGISAAKAISQTSAVPIIFLTADTDERTLQRAMPILPYGYLIKPFDPFELRSTIEVALQRHEMRSAGGTEEAVDRTEEESTFEVEPSGEKADILRNIPLFKNLSPATISALADRAMLKQHDGAETLISPDKDSSGGFIPLSGRVSITRVSEAGKELVVALVGPGDIFGLFYSLKTFNGSSWAQTQVPSKMLWFPEAALQQILHSHPDLMNLITEELAKRLMHAHQLSISLAHSRVENRITMMLFTLLQEFGKETGNADTGRIFITRRELADLVGTTPETAIRVTKNLEREGMLDLTRPGIIKVPSITELKKWAARKQQESNSD